MTSPRRHKSPYFTYSGEVTNCANCDICTLDSFGRVKPYVRTDIILLVLSRKVLIVEMRLSAVSEDINEILLIKNNFITIKIYLTLQQAILYLGNLSLLSIVLLFFACELKTGSMMS